MLLYKTFDEAKSACDEDSDCAGFTVSTFWGLPTYGTCRLPLETDTKDGAILYAKAGGFISFFIILHFALTVQLGCFDFIHRE